MRTLIFSVLSHIAVLVLLIQEKPAVTTAHETNFDVVFTTAPDEEPRNEVCSEQISRYVDCRALPKKASLAMTHSTLTPASHHGLNNPLPRYPLVARKRGHEGTVTLTIKISPQGTCEAVKLASSSGYRYLDEAAQKAVLNWQFYPALKRGRKIHGQVNVSFSFKLTGLEIT